MFFLLLVASAVGISQPARGAPGIDYIRIVDGPGGGGVWVSGRNYIFGDTDTFWAAGYNVSSGFVSAVDAFWYLANYTGNATQWSPDVVSMNVTNGPSVQVFTNGYGAARVGAYTNLSMGLSNTTGPLHVSVSNVASIIIRTDPAGGGTWVGDRTYTGGVMDTFYAAAYGSGSTFLGDIAANWTSSNPNVGGVGVSWGSHPPYASFRAMASGYTYVTAAPAGMSLTNTTGNLTVNGYASVRVVDAPGGAGSWVSTRDYLLGDKDTFYAAGYDAAGRWIADVWVNWYVAPNPYGWGGSVVVNDRPADVSVTITAVGAGVGNVTVLFAPPQGGPAMVNSTGPLRVSVANVDRVVIRQAFDPPGTWVGDRAYPSDAWVTFEADAFNTTTGYLGGITSNWTTTNPSSFNMGEAALRAIAELTVHMERLGEGYVTIAAVGTVATSTSGKLTVTGIGVDFIQIRDAPNGGGQVVGNRTYYPGEVDTYYAALYNLSVGYLGGSPAAYTSNNSAVCRTSVYSGYNWSYAELYPESPGACTVEVMVRTSVSGTITNTTGTLTVLPRPRITVDDSGGADFTSIQPAVDAAQVGTVIYVYDGRYNEHVVVAKEIEIEGQSKQTASHQSVVLDGGGTGAALRITADRVVVHNLTIQNASYGVFQDHTNRTRLYDSVVQDYGTGVYNNVTLNAWAAYNLITRGEIGVVAYRAYDDAIRWNEISHNTQYGGKGYNAHLLNCFNWNTLHDNRIGYWYDPTTDLPPMEFDGNVIADNDVGVKVSDTSAIALTNNTITGGQTGVELMNSSSEVRANALSGMAVGIRFQASSSNLTGNEIVATDVGIEGNGGSPRIEGVDITVDSGNAMVLSNLDGAIIRGNNVHGGTILISNSRIEILSLVDSVAILEDSAVGSLTLDASSRVEVRWTVRVRAVDVNSDGVGGAGVKVTDTRGSFAFLGPTGADGFTPPFLVTTEIQTPEGVTVLNPFAIEISYDGARARLLVSVDRGGDIVVGLPTGARRDVVAALTAAILVSASLAVVVAVERSRYAFLAAFLPLYSRLSRDKILESYNRGRVYEYIELNPGVHFHAILSALDMNSGSLVYHLEVLCREGLVTSRQEGMYRRFFPKGVRPPPLVENGTTPTQQLVLKAIQEMPGVTQKELAKFLGLRQSTLAYQTDRLAAMGYIAGEKRGRQVRYTAKKGGA